MTNDHDHHWGDKVPLRSGCPRPEACKGRPCGDHGGTPEVYRQYCQFILSGRSRYLVIQCPAMLHTDRHGTEIDRVPVLPEGERLRYTAGK